MSEPVNTDSLNPTEQLRGKNLVLTGCTGFLGKVVLAMLLDRYPDIGHIFALIRPGIRERAADRFRQGVLPSAALNPVRERFADEEAFTDYMLTKVTPVDGNVIKEGCAVSAEDMAMLNQRGVHVVVNSAGLVDFDPPVDQALRINAFGARHMIQLAQRLTANLVHVSTCFVAGRRNGQILEDDAIIDRIPFDGDGTDYGAGGERPQAPGGEDFEHEAEIEKLSQIAQEIRDQADDAALKAKWRAAAVAQLEEDGRDPDDPKAVKSAILRQRKIWLGTQLRRAGMERAEFWGWTNTYTFTKHLGEQLVAAAVEREGLNACIVRPSIVESALNFPFPGWNEGFTTTAPLILLSRNGLPHMPYAKDLVLDIVPVDMVAGTIVAAVVATLAGPHKLVLHAATGDTNPLTIGQSIEFTGLGARRRARTLQRKGLGQRWLRHNETVPVNKKSYELLGLPRWQKGAELLAKGANRAWQFGWARNVLSYVRDEATTFERDTNRVTTILNIFMPFIADNYYVFRSDNTRQLFSRMPEAEVKRLCYAPTSFVWRDYWFDVHVPGLEKWVLPSLQAELMEAPETAYMYRSLTELFEAATHQHRHRVAFEYHNKTGIERLTYGELRLLAQRVAGYVGTSCAAGEPGEGDKPATAREAKVLLLGENRPEWVAAYFGIILAGATVVPVDAEASAAEIRTIAATCGARGVMLSPQVRERLRRDEETGTIGPPLWEMRQAINHRPALARSARPAKIASIIFTSGTTGVPKGVMLSHRNFTFEVSRLLGVFDLGVTDHLLSVLPLHHTFEFSAGLLSPLARGSKISYLEKLDSDSLSAVLESGVTGLIGVPALWDLLRRRIESRIEDAGPLAELVLEGVGQLNAFLREYADFNPGGLMAYPVHRALGGRLQHLVSGGSALNPEVLDFFRSLGFDMTEGYGLTEAAPVLAVTKPGDKLPLGSVGNALSGVELRIAEANEEGVGEVQARGPNIMAGYFDDAAATAEAMTDDGFLRTGDLGRLDHKGRLFLSGRMKDVIVGADGRNVYPDDLEDVFSNHPDIDELSVVGFDADGRERVAALIVPRSDGVGSVSDGGVSDGVLAEQRRARIDAHIRRTNETLPYYRRIKLWHLFAGPLPRTATRKVKRAQVKRLLTALNQAHRSAQELSGTLLGAGATPQLDRLRALVAQVSGRPTAEIGGQTGLTAELGFDSLMFVELAALMDSVDPGSLPSNTALASAETVEELALLWGRGDAPSPLQPMRGRLAEDVFGGGGASDSTKEESVWVPAPLRKIGRRLLSVGQQRFYDALMDVGVRGQAHIPKHTAFLVAANHASHLDAGLVKTALGQYGRGLVALAARDYFFGSKLRRAYFEHFTNVLPIERHGSIRHSLRQALGVLADGRSLLVFPEGTRSADGVMATFKPSIGYLAENSGVPLLPMYLWGTYAAMPKGSTLLPKQRRIGAAIGQPLLPEHFARLAEGVPTSEAHRRATTLVERAVRALQEGGSYRVSVLLHQLMRELEAGTPAASDERGVPKTEDEPARVATRVGPAHAGEGSP